jgi:hypothetical protein
MLGTTELAKVKAAFEVAAKEAKGGELSRAVNMASALSAGKNQRVEHDRISFEPTRIP